MAVHDRGEQGELVLTYAELAARLGVSADGARTKARRAGWSVARGNDGRARVRVRASELPGPGEQTGSLTGQTGRSGAHYDRRRSTGEQTARAAELAERTELQQQVADLRVALGRAETRIEARDQRIADLVEQIGREQRHADELADLVVELRRPWLARMLAALRR